MPGAKSCLLSISIRSTLAAADDERTVKDNAAVMMRRMYRSPDVDDDQQNTGSIVGASHDSSAALCRR
jgi:hypothetical protein